MLKSILAVIVSIPTLTVFYIKYRLSLARARRSAYREFRNEGIPEEYAKELLDLVAPDLGGLRKWMNLGRSESFS